MAIKQRKQLTGTTTQINAYAGVEGQLVWDKTKKKWVGMSGTAGTNYPMASERHTHTIANVTGLQVAIDGKQAKGDYATSKALTDGLAGKANTSHTHTVANVTGLQEALNGKLGATAKAASASVADRANSVDWNNVRNKPTIPSSEGVHVIESGENNGSWWRKWSNGMIEQKIHFERADKKWNPDFSLVKPLTTILSSCATTSYESNGVFVESMHEHFVMKLPKGYYLVSPKQIPDVTTLFNLTYDVYLLGS